MTKQEKRLVEVEKRVESLEEVFKSFMAEMRDRDNQRSAEIMEIRQDMKGMQKDFYAKMDNLDAKIDGIGKHVQNLTVAAMVGMSTAVIGIGAIAVTVMYSVFSR